jgi:sulfite exporter TauE/SafE
VFIFGPCEPLIPLIMYPAAEGTMADVAVVALVFGATTIATMLGVVLVSSYGLARVSFGRLERYAHALAGLTILASGGAIKLLGL